MKFLSTGRAQVRSVKFCVLFDPSDGAIRHTQRVVTLDGADETPEEQIEKRTLMLATELGLEVKKLKVLHFDAEDIEPGKRYAVNPATGRLVEVERREKDPTQYVKKAAKKSSKR
jgi:hypothetical protein